MTMASNVNMKDRIIAIPIQPASTRLGRVSSPSAQGMRSSRASFYTCLRAACLRASSSSASRFARKASTAASEPE